MCCEFVSDWLRKVFTATLLVPITLVLGCGSVSDFPPTYPVKGTVFHGGKAVENATVTFEMMEGKGNAFGSTDKQGVFELSTFSPADGAVAGQYKVKITKYDGDAPVAVKTPPPGQLAPPGLAENYAPPAVSARGAAAGGSKNLLPEKYANSDTSGLRALVKQGSNDFKFDLK